MLISLVIVGALLTDEFSWLSSDTSHINAAQSPTPIFTPEEPFTITLALIGIGTIVAYLAVSRVVRRHRVAQSIERAPVADAGVSIDKRSRGAA